MTGLNEKTSPWLVRALAICTVFGMLAFAGGRLIAQDDKPWAAPADERKVKNPVPATPENLTAAATLYKAHCVLCHGDQGKGDGVAGKFSKVPPSNFTDAKLIGAETDGSLFWKISEGKNPMPAWKTSLTETERWQLVNYVRKLNKDANPK